MQLLKGGRRLSSDTSQNITIRIVILCYHQEQAYLSDLSLARRLAQLLRCINNLDPNQTLFHIVIQCFAAYNLLLVDLVICQHVTQVKIQ